MSQSVLNAVQFKASKDKAGGEINAHHGDTLVGRLDWSHNIGAVINSVWTHPEYRHQGIATSMYHLATRELGHMPSHSRTRSDDGEGWSQAVGGRRPPRVKA